MSGNRTLLVLPLLVLWANLHGSVVLGAGLAMLLGLVELVRARRLEWIPLALVVLSPLCVLATPYGWDIVAYYKLMLVDAPFAPILREWQWSSPSGTTALFWLLALVAAGVLALRRCRTRLTFYELAVLVVTFLGAVQAVRGVIWFALAAAAILPVALDGLLTKKDIAAPKLNRIISLAALAGLAVAALAFVARPASWFVSEWPEARVAAVREATRDPSARVWATDGTADWLLWRIPDLRGRLAYDVRFELYDQPTLDRIVDYGTRNGDWQRSLDGYRVVIVDDRAHLRGARLGARRADVSFSDDDVAVVQRRVVAAPMARPPLCPLRWLPASHEAGSLRAAFTTVWRWFGVVALVGAMGLLTWRLAQFEPTGWLALDFKLGAAQRLVDGRTLYPADASGEYPYPPLWAMLVSPFLLLPLGFAKYLACTLCAGAIVAALWILGCRDPCCFAAALVSGPVVGGTQIGNVSAFVALLLALGYRYNSSPIGLAVALKLYAWPLLLWSAIRRGVRDLLLGVGVTADGHRGAVGSHRLRWHRPLSLRCAGHH